MTALRLMAVLAHPDDESLGVGGTLAAYAAEGVEVHVVTATRGERGRYFTPDQHPGTEVVGRVREKELRSAARELGVYDVQLLGYMDGEVDRAEPVEAIARIAGHLRRVRPQVVLTFDSMGAYGHPDHIAISQLTTAALVAAAGTAPQASGDATEPHRVSKLYHMAWDDALWTIYQRAFKRMSSTVDGEVRHASPWPAWSITTRIDARAHGERVWRAVRCHETQMSVYGALADLSPADHETLWGTQGFYRAMSLVNGGRATERDLFAGLR
jgi:LmbE family N-acetylglucosaminyl deacetylase